MSTPEHDLTWLSRLRVERGTRAVGVAPAGQQARDGAEHAQMLGLEAVRLSLIPWSTSAPIADLFTALEAELARLAADERAHPDNASRCRLARGVARRRSGPTLCECSAWSAPRAPSQDSQPRKTAMHLTPERRAALIQQRESLARVAAHSHVRTAAARELGRRYAAERLTFAEIFELLTQRGMPSGLSGPTATVNRLAPGAGLTCRDEIDSFLEGVNDVAAMLWGEHVKRLSKAGRRMGVRKEAHFVRRGYLGVALEERRTSQLRVANSHPRWVKIRSARTAVASLSYGTHRWITR